MANPALATESRAQGHAPLALAGLVFAGVVLRLVGLRGQGLWLDEAYTITLVWQSPAAIVAQTALDNHPPLYYLLLHGWLALVGRGLVEARLFSVLCGTLTVAVGAALAGRIAGRRAALVTAGLLAGCPFLVYYSQEVRQYALLGLLGVTASYAVWRLGEVNSPSGRWALLFGLCSALSLYTMYIGGLVLVGNVVWGWRVCGQTTPLVGNGNGGRIARHPDNGRARQRLLLALAGSVLVFVPWLPTLWAQVHRLAAIIEPQNSLLKLPATLLVWLGGYTQTRHSFYARDAQALVLLVLEALVALGLIAALVGLWRSRAAERGALGLLWPALLPAAVLWTVSLRKPMYLTYTLLPCAALFLVAAGVALARLKAPGRAGLLALCGVLCALSLGAYWTNPEVGRGDTFRRLADWARPRLTPGTTLVCGNEGPYLAVAAYATLEAQGGSGSGEPSHGARLRWLSGQAFLVTPPKIAPASRQWPPLLDLQHLPHGRVLLARNEAEPWPEALQRRLPPPTEEILVPGSHQCPAMRAGVYDLP